LELQVGDIIQVQGNDFVIGDPASRFLIVKDPLQFNLSNKSKFSCWDTHYHRLARVTIIDNNYYQDILTVVKPEFEDVKYLAVAVATSYLASINMSEDEPAIWHEIIIRKAEDEE
jgi:hypothetical protein